MVVAAAPIGPRTVISTDMLRVQQLPLAAIHPSAFRSPMDVIGKVARVAVTRDEQLLSSKVFLQNAESGLAFMVPDGMRAVSVAVSEQIGSGGLIVPGDHVDVIGVFEMKTPGAPAGSIVTPAPTPAAPIVKQPDRALMFQGAAAPGEQQTTFVSTIVLEDVSVLAIAQQLEGQDTRDNPTRIAQNAGLNGPAAGPQQQLRSDPQPMPAAKTATLAVAPDDALKLVLAEDHGHIRLALRRGADSATAQSARAPMTALGQPAGR